MNTAYPNPEINIDHIRLAETVKLMMDYILPNENITKYPEQENGFDHLGMDVMFRENGDPVIIEINIIPSVGEMITKNYLELVRYSAFEYIFGNPENTIDNEYVTKVSEVNIK